MNLQGDSLYKHNKNGVYVGYKRADIPEVIRFWSKVLVGGEGCWEWQAATHSLHGYGAFDRKYAHAFIATRYMKVKCTRKMVIDHICRNRRCVRPSHLRFVPQRENLMNSDGMMGRRLKQTHCKNGHPLNGDNLVPDRYRCCRICKYAYNRAYKKAKRLRRKGIAI